jgi:UDP-N-acetylglucosamine transferase subunit ALG13
MYSPDGKETLVQFFRDGKEFRVAMDDETYAHLMNDPGVEIGEELMTFTRLDPFTFDTGLPRELRGRSATAPGQQKEKGK